VIPATRISTAERFGRWLGRGWRGYLRGERRVLEWLVAKDVPEWVANALVWAVKLAVLGVLLYVAFWIVLLMLFVLFTGLTTAVGGSNTKKWWPFTDLTELRETLGYDPNLYDDISHPMYTDD